MPLNDNRIKQLSDTHNVLIFFPHEAAEQSTVLLVYDPSSPSPDDKNKHLDDVKNELLKMAKDAADVSSQSIPVEKRWHEAVLGPGGTTLNA